MDELELYNINCDGIENILINKNNEQTDISAKNDQKYRDLRKIILSQKKTIEDQADKIKILETIINKEEDINIKEDNNKNTFLSLFK